MVKSRLPNTLIITVLYTPTRRPGTATRPTQYPNTRYTRVGGRTYRIHPKFDLDMKGSLLLPEAPEAVDYV